MKTIIRPTILFLALVLWLELVSLGLTWQQQMVLGGISIVLGLLVNRVSPSRLITLGLILISLTATCRYAWWRFRTLAEFFTDPTTHHMGFDALLMLVLICAEVYTFVIMVLGYMQTAWPLQRKPLPLPNDEGAWPHVDILIPTYNEPLTLVRYTALAALNIDYPPEKLHVYILDDGTRDDFAEFAKMAGVGYITRDKHNHAKAGNINHALTMIDSPYVAIFDCDHVPTRSFLQITLGWMLADNKLAMLQTPHYFYSPDPFERNLLQYKTIPSEAELFYGIVQDGNDLWNATFFCGSCAVIRRSALDEVGGIAVETVTEDAHTALRMQKRGYNTAYINIPQAAGLATETLAAHVGQRIRWARGMIQIFRTDNPLLARGLKFSQRLCYLNAMLHFLYAAPRLIFLCAPLVYMLLGKSIIPGYWVAILAYSLPHLILASLTNSRIQSRHRHSFWNEIYEAVLAPYILAPTLLALINPKLGKFNVTDKGSTLNDTRFDRKIATPTRWLLFLNVVGLLMTPYRIFVNDPHHPGTVIMNLVWILFNMVILGVAAAVAHEQKQRRNSVRIEARIPVRLELPDRTTLDTVSIDMSVGGASVKMPAGTPLAVGDQFRLGFPHNAGEASIGASVVGMKAEELRLKFSTPTIQEQETLTIALYSRADAWVNSADSREPDQPLKSLGRVIVLSFHGFYQILRSILPEKRPVPVRKAVVTPTMLLLVLLGGFAVLRASAQPTGTEPSAVSAPITEISPPSPAMEQVINMENMGVAHDLEFRGPHSYRSVHFTLPYTLVPTESTLKLRYAFEAAPGLRAASIKVNLNGNEMLTLSPQMASGGSHMPDEADIPVAPDQLVHSNTLTFEFIGSGAMVRRGQEESGVLARIGFDSRIAVSGEKLHLKNDLSQLPLPLFENDLQTKTTIPFLFLDPPTTKTLQAAGVVASWFGVLARARQPEFVSLIGEIPAGDLVLFCSRASMLPPSLQVPSGGPVFALRDNPSDPHGSVLVIYGDDDDQLLAAARALAQIKTTAASAALLSASTEDTALVAQGSMPPARRDADAPRWLPLTDRASLTTGSSQDKFETADSNSIPLYFHLPPDLFYGEREKVRMRVHYRYTANSVVPGSALRIIVNGQLLHEVPLVGGAGLADRQITLAIPVIALRPFGNTALFNFDIVQKNQDGTRSSEGPSFQGEIVGDSSLDLHGLSLWTRMPSLQLFADAGFPFTNKADLSDTVVILPQVPGSGEISVFLNQMSRFGAQTGYPALRVTVGGPDLVLTSAKDYLVIGAVANQPAFASLANWLPATFDGEAIHVQSRQSVLSQWNEKIGFWQASLFSQAWIDPRPSGESGSPTAMIEEIESPSSLERSIVVIALKSDAAAPAFSRVYNDELQSHRITGTVSLLQLGGFESFPMDGFTYHAGTISWLAQMRLWLHEHFVLLLLAVTVLNLIVAWWMRDWLSAKARARLKLEEAFPSQATPSVS